MALTSPCTAAVMGKITHVMYHVPVRKLTEFRRKVPENLREKQKITESAQPPLQI